MDQQQQYNQQPMGTEKQAQGYPNNSPPQYPPNAALQEHHQQPSYQPHQHPDESHQYSHSAGSHGSWTFGLFDCCSPFGTCCMGYWCPCFLYGRTYARDHGDPDASAVNGSCCAWYMLSCFGAQCILQCINRTSIRERHGIEGGSFGDFCTSCCCTCCALIQEEKESVVRNTGINPKTDLPYSPPSQMTYP
ncbi:uncharacterized protein PV06_10225 [Exophiala oligosperma]|uniref:Uncharacterized protein n=1 Tax=Exophiala oligosperma TaxID=215243 RepID=A0A0D2DP36_9EURO|nr:uncharacterized protein PV06_10225 [Exophiala oligosperma]KIW37579.1 hypothetical protein PV06_10225 [Exophiala oligosperma]